MNPPDRTGRDGLIATAARKALQDELQEDEGYEDEDEQRLLNLNEEEIRFLTQVQRYSAHLSESDRRLLLAMVRKFAQTTLS